MGYRGIYILFTLLLVFPSYSSIGIFSVWADSLPPGTTVTTGFDYGSITIFNHAFTNTGPQTFFFPDSDTPIDSISVNVTTFVSGAVLYFTINGVEYSFSVTPNTNYLITFSGPVNISDVKISISDRGFPDDQTNVGYIPDIVNCWDLTENGVKDIPPYIDYNIISPLFLGFFTGSEDTNGDSFVDIFDCSSFPEDFFDFLKDLLDAYDMASDLVELAIFLNLPIVDLPEFIDFSKLPVLINSDIKILPSDTKLEIPIHIGPGTEEFFATLVFPDGTTLINYGLAGLGIGTSVIVGPIAGLSNVITIGIINPIAGDYILNVETGGTAVLVASVNREMILILTPVETPVGGEILPIDNNALLLASVQSTTWLIPIILSIVGIGLVLVRRKFA